MTERIAVHRLVFPAVNAKVRLAVAVKIELAQGDAAFDRPLENSGADVHPMPDDIAGQPDIH